MITEDVHEEGNMTLRHVYPDGTTPEQVEKDRALANNHTDSVLERGATHYRMRFKRKGRLCLAMEKEVGPPPWRFPKAGLKIRRSKAGSPSIFLMVGWRSTMYIAGVMWRKKDQ